MIDLDCYRIVICTLATCDTQTNLVTFTLVHEAWTLPAEMLGSDMPLQAHFAIRGDGAYDVRPVWVATDGSTEPAGGASDTVAAAAGALVRFAAMHIRIPGAFGEFDLALQWRPARSAEAKVISADERRWHLAKARAPISVREAAAPQAPAVVH